ncbi:MAG: HTH-type transcriptional regulator Xre [Syntrophomonadaceae bacterium]|nr:HTH-type transcriptional regulator Xre [Bacillota bacterium]
MSYYSENQKENLIKVGDRLRELREKKGATQDELAEYMEVQRSTVAKWENGAQDFKSAAIVRLARYFNCSIDYLLLGASAETYEIYSTTGLIDAAVSQLGKYKEIEDMLYDRNEPGPLGVLNEMLSDEEFFTLLTEFVLLRAKWKKIQVETAEQELLRKKTEPRSKERKEAGERLIQLKDDGEFLLWKFSRSIDSFTRKLLEVK